MKIETILEGAKRIINDLIHREFIAQGHYLTGASLQALEGRVVKFVRSASLNGYGLPYMARVNEGIEPENIKPNMIPGLIRYFVLRGLVLPEAEKAAWRTYAKWKKEGMSTQASKRFSSTGGRQHFIELAFLNTGLDEYMNNIFDFAVDEEFKKTKNETV
jgi:hypothetical protein